MFVLHGQLCQFAESWCLLFFRTSRMKGWAFLHLQVSNSNYLIAQFDLPHWVYQTLGSHLWPLKLWLFFKPSRVSRSVGALLLVARQLCAKLTSEFSNSVGTASSVNVKCLRWMPGLISPSYFTAWCLMFFPFGMFPIHPCLTSSLAPFGILNKCDFTYPLLYPDLQPTWKHGIFNCRL